MDDETQLSALQAAARAADTIARENSEARTLALDAETRAIDAIVATIPPTVIRAIGTRPITSWTRYWIDNAQTDERQTRAAWRGILIAGKGAPTAVQTHSTGAEYRGEGLYLAEDGACHELTYSGAQSYWQGSTSEWTTVDRVITTREIVDEWQSDPLATIAESLSAALTRYLEGAARTRAESYRAKAARYDAIATLIGGSK